MRVLALNAGSSYLEWTLLDGDGGATVGTRFRGPTVVDRAVPAELPSLVQVAPFDGGGGAASAFTASACGGP